MRNMSTITGMLGDTPTGTWRIDPAHRSASFSVRHQMSKVREHRGRGRRELDVEAHLEEADSS